MAANTNADRRKLHLAPPACSRVDGAGGVPR